MGGGKGTLLSDQEGGLEDGKGKGGGEVKDSKNRALGSGQL